MSAEVSGDQDLPIVEEPVFHEVPAGAPVEDEKSGRAFVLALGLAAIGLGGGAWLGYDRFIKEDPVPPPEEAIIADSHVDCSQMITSFQPRTEREMAIFRGEPLTFVGRQPSHALKTYYENRNALLAFECNTIASQTTEDITGRLFAIHVETVPVEGTDKAFEVRVSLTASE